METKQIVKYGIYGCLGVVGLIVASTTISMVTSPLRTTSGVVERTMDSANVLNTYERFHDTWKAFDARVAQLNSTKRLLSSETDQSEIRRFRIELEAQKQSCRELAAKYNADAAKTNRVIFQGREAPSTLNQNLCEG